MDPLLFVYADFILLPRVNLNLLQRHKWSIRVVSHFFTKTQMTRTLRTCQNSVRSPWPIPTCSLTMGGVGSRSEHSSVSEEQTPSQQTSSCSRIHEIKANAELDSETIRRLNAYEKLESPIPLAAVVNLVNQQWKEEEQAIPVSQLF